MSETTVLEEAEQPAPAPSDGGTSRWSEDLRLLGAAFPGMRGRFILVTVLGIAGAVTEALIVLMIAGLASMLAAQSDEFTGAIVGQTVTISTLSISLILLGVVLLRAVFDLLLIETRARMEAAYERSARGRIVRMYLDAGWDLQSAERRGGLQSLLIGFISHGRGLLQQLTGTMVATVSLAIMVATSLTVNLVATVCVVAGLLFFGYVLRPLVRRGRLASVANRDATVRFSDRIGEMVAMALEIRTVGVSDQVEDRLRNDIDELASAQYRASTASFRLVSVHSSLTYFAVAAGMFALLAMDIDDPQPYAAMILLLYRSMVYGRSVQSGYQNVTGAQPYLLALNERLTGYQEAGEERGSAEPDRVGEVHFVDVNYSYAAESLALRNVTFDIGAREALGIVGASGAGKSTVIQLLLGLRHPEAGSVQFGSIDIREVSPQALTRLVGYVPQEAHLFDDTVIENVRCFREEISEEDAIEALRSAHVLEEILAMPDGLQTQVGVGGSQLSGGQRQRVCIARALASSPDLLILDEPTSALDLASEERIRQTLESLRGQMSLVVIAHRMSTLRVCDRVLVMKDGTVDAIGSRDYLEQNSDYYSEALRLAKLV